MALRNLPLCEFRDETLRWFIVLAALIRRSLTTPSAVYARSPRSEGVGGVEFSIRFLENVVLQEQKHPWRCTLPKASRVAKLFWRYLVFSVEVDEWRTKSDNETKNCGDCTPYVRATVDGRNPKQPPGMYKTSKQWDKLPYQLVCRISEPSTVIIS